MPIKNSETKYSRRCKVCHKPLHDCYPNYRNCGSERCIRERNRIKSHAWAKKNIWGQPKQCAVCGTTFKRSQSKKKFCGDACAEVSAKEVRLKAYLKSRGRKEKP